MKNENKISVVILAGGKSERMNFPKPFLLFDNQKTFLEKIFEEYLDFGCNEILVVLNNELLSEKWEKYLAPLSFGEGLGVRFIPNYKSDLGRFYSLTLGLSKLKNCDYCFLQNVDNPFVTAEILNKLFQNKNENGYTAPYFLPPSPLERAGVRHQGGHPILLSKTAIDQIKNLKSNDLTLKDVLSKFQKKTVRISDEKILANINTEDDYKKYFSQTKKETSKVFKTFEV